MIVTSSIKINEQPVFFRLMALLPFIVEVPGILLRLHPRGDRLSCRSTGAVHPMGDMDEDAEGVAPGTRRATGASGYVVARNAITVRSASEASSS